jgi:hypothetical protein
MQRRTPDAAAKQDAEMLLELFGPPLLDALGGQEPATRERAARALCAIADAEQSAVEPITTRLLARLRGPGADAPFGRTIATIAQSYPEAVARALDAADASQRRRESLQAATVWEFAPETSADRGTSPATADGGTDPATLVHDVVGESDNGPTVHTSSDQTAADAPDILPPAEEAADTPSPDPAAVGRRKRIERAESSRIFRAIEMYGAFEELSVLEPEQAIRYGSALRSRATTAETELGLAVRLIDLPDAGADRRRFAAGVAEQLAAWDGVTDHPAILTLHDWGDQPRPWLATEYVNGTLADRGEIPIERALAEAIHLTKGLAHCHRNGVVHGGIDPHSVVYPEATLEGLPKPRLDNLGLFQEVATHLSPRAYLDARFAAPEYFDTDCGPVDQSTDVYQLGATLYRLLTGRAPYTGDRDAVRDGVLHDQPQAPSELRDLPPAVDPIFEKALATRKFTRYESVAALRADLTAVRQTLA